MPQAVLRGQADKVSKHGCAEQVAWAVSPVEPGAAEKLHSQPAALNYKFALATNVAIMALQLSVYGLGTDWALRYLPALVVNCGMTLLVVIVLTAVECGLSPPPPQVPQLDLHALPVLALLLTDAYLLLAGTHSTAECPQLHAMSTCTHVCTWSWERSNAGACLDVL